MRIASVLAVLSAAHIGCATGAATGAGTAAAPGPENSKPWKVSYSRNYDTRNSNMVNSKRVPLDDEMLEGVWNDASEATIAIVHREGEELRLVIAVGDTRPNIPLTMFEVTDMGNHLPGPDARERAKEALMTWRSGPPTGKNRYFWALAGKHVTPEVAQGSWADANAGCESSHYWGNFTLFLQKDKHGAPVLMASVMASAKKFGGGIGGQDFEFSRIMYFEKSVKPIPSGLLDNLQKTENFCRKTAEN